MYKGFSLQKILLIEEKNLPASCEESVETLKRQKNGGLIVRKDFSKFNGWVQTKLHLAAIKQSFKLDKDSPEIEKIKNLIKSEFKKLTGVDPTPVGQRKKKGSKKGSALAQPEITQGEDSLISPTVLATIDEVPNTFPGKQERLERNCCTKLDVLEKELSDLREKYLHLEEKHNRLESKLEDLEKNGLPSLSDEDRVRAAASNYIDTHERPLYKDFYRKFNLHRFSEEFREEIRRYHFVRVG